MKLTWTIIGVLLAAAAGADTILLQGGGVVDGKVDQIVFERDGKTQTLRRGAFVALALREDGPDAVQLRDLAVEEGRVATLEIKCVGGLLTFRRGQLTAVAMKQADHVKLATGATFECVVTEVAFEAGGVRERYRRGKFTGVWLAAGKPDTVLADGRRRTGKLTSISVRSGKDRWTFRREELSGIALPAVAVEAARRVYLLSRARIAKDDVAGLYRLASWCEDNGLITEARELAARCLKAGPERETAALCEWMLGAEMEAGVWIKPPPASMVLKNPRPKVDPALVRRFRTLSDEYRRAIAARKAAEAAEVKSQHEAAWQAALKSLAEIEAKRPVLEKREDDLGDQLSDERSLARRLIEKKGVGDDFERNPDTATEYEIRRRMLELRRDREDVREELRELRRREETVRRQQRATYRRVKPAMTAVSARDRARRQALDLAQQKVRRLLLLGRTLTEPQMRAVLDATFRR